MTQSAFDLLDEKYSVQPPLKIIEDPEPDSQEVDTLAPAAIEPVNQITNALGKSGSHHDCNPGQDKPQDKPGSQLKGSRRPLMDWKDSEPVKLLSGFLKEFHDQGIYMKQTKDGGLPILCFNPGLKPEDQDAERWAMGTHAMDLMDHARQDLKELIANGALTLQPYKGIWL